MKKQQQGVVLIVSLIILLVVTMMGTVAMQGTGMELKMAKNSQERQRVFQITEAALRRVEQGLQDTPFTEAALKSNACNVGDATCFENTCAGGLCFFGKNEDTHQQECEVVSGTPSSQPVWFDPAYDVWNTPGRNQIVNPAIALDVGVQYIIEFLCFVDNSTGTVRDSANGGIGAGDVGDAFYRVTVLGTGRTGRIQVMLQSTYSVPEA